MEEVDFTQEKFNKIKSRKEDYRDKEVALLQYFINETENIENWDHPGAIYNALVWLIEILKYMKQNRQNFKADKGLNRFLYRKDPLRMKHGELLSLYKNMKGGWGTKYTGAIKNDIKNRIIGLEKSLNNLNPNAISWISIPDNVSIPNGSNFVEWKIESMQKAESTKIPNTEQELSDYDKKNNKDSWEKIVEKRKKIYDDTKESEQIKKNKSTQLKTKKLIIGADEKTDKKKEKNRSKTFFGLHDTLKWTWKGR